MSGPQVSKPEMEMSRSVVVLSSLMLNWSSCEALLIGKTNSPKDGVGGWCCCQPVEMSHPPLMGLWDPRQSKGGAAIQPGLGWRAELEAFTSHLVVRLICRVKWYLRALFHSLSQTEVGILVVSLFAILNHVVASSLLQHWHSTEQKEKGGSESEPVKTNPEKESLTCGR